MTQKNDLNSQASRCSCTTLRKASRRISQLYDAALAPSGLKTTQRAILAQIRRSEATTVGNLAEALVMDAGALAHTLKPLERDGLISIDVDPDDRRTAFAEIWIPWLRDTMKRTPEPEDLAIMADPAVY